MRRIRALAGDVAPRKGRVARALFGVAVAGCAGLLATSSVAAVAWSAPADFTELQSFADFNIAGDIAITEFAAQPETEEHSDWSPDGKWIAFNARREGAWSELFVMPAAGGEVRRVTSLAQNSYNPSWSPDGRWIAFCARDQGPFQLHAIPLAGGPHVQLTDSFVQHTGPRWSPDGNRIVFDYYSGDVAIAEVGNLESLAERATRAASLASKDDGGMVWHVDGHAQTGGDGSAKRPFRTIQAALDGSSYGDTVRLEPGTYLQPVELISGVTLLGAGADRTRVTSEAHFGLAIRPFIQYFEPPGQEEPLHQVGLRDVVMKDQNAVSV